MRDSAGFAPASLLPRRPGICARRREDTATELRRHAQTVLARDLSRSGTRSSPATSRTRTRPGSRSGSSRSACASSSPRRCPTRSRRSPTSSTASATRVDHLIVTGGLGGTPDDLTREALAAAFGVAQVEVPELAAELRARFPRHPDYAARWAQLPAGSRPLRNPNGGAPGFVIENVWVLPGLPSEMEAMFDAYADELARRAADRVVAARLPDARERHRPPARGRDRALAAGRASARTRASSRTGPRSRSCSSRPTRRRSPQAVAWLEPELARRGRAATA